MRAMPEGYLEIVRNSFDAWMAGDFDRMVRGFHPDVVIVAPEGWPDGAVTEGAEAWKRQAARLREDWEDAGVEVDELREAGPDTVLARIRYVTRGTGPELAFDTPVFVAFLFADGMLVRAEYCWDEDGALAAAERGAEPTP